jgi:diguanylate cyclase (GGDEF)-like protein/PAS domain S-box-containing protein
MEYTQELPVPPVDDEARQWNATFNAIKDAICILNQEGRIIRHNQAFEKIMGRTSQEIAGNLCSNLLHYSETFIDVCPLLLARQTGRRANLEIQIGLEWFRITVDPVFAEDGNLMRFVHVMTDVTDRKRTEAALRVSETRYRSLFDNMLDGFAYCEMVFDDNGRPVDFVYLEVNHAFEQLTGLKDVAGKKVSEVIPGTQEVHPELLEIYGRVASTGRPERFEIEFQPLGIWLLISVYSTEKKKFVAVFENLTDRKQADKALKESENRLRSAFDASVIGIALVALDGRWLKVNQSLCATVGYSEEELLEKTIQDITHQDDVDNDCEYARRLIEDQIPCYQIEKRFYHKDGYIIWAMVSSSLVRDARGYPLYAVIQIENTTERKLLEEKLHTISKMDELTGLYNRRGFFELATEQLRIASRNEMECLLFYVDLDRMKWINDTLGHNQGDAALVKVGQLLKDTFRESDIVGRIGGDEFAILAIGTSESERDQILTRLRDKVARCNDSHSLDFSISLSVGAARCESEHSLNLEELMAQADQSMYEEKRSKRGCR